MGTKIVTPEGGQGVKREKIYGKKRRLFFPVIKRRGGGW